MATTNFITNETNLISEKKTVELSKLLLWYKSDFIDNESQCNKTPDQLLLEYNLKFFYKVREFPCNRI